MRIAVVCTDQGVRIPGAKGASLHLAAISRAFVELGHEVLMVGVAGHGDPPTQVRTFLLPHPGRAEGLAREHNKLALTQRFATEGLQAVGHFGADLVYERLALFGTAGLEIARSLDLPHLLEVNALLAREEAQWRGLHLQDEATHREATVLAGTNHVIAVSDELAAAVGASTAAANVSVVPNGFDEEAFSTEVDPLLTRDSLGLSATGPLIVFAGSLRAWHGVENAIRAVPHLAPGVTLVIAGTGPLEASLVALAESLGVRDRVVFLGERPHQQVVDLLRAADVGIAPYPALDNFSFSPLKLYEYLAAGLPFVASDVGQIRDVVDVYRTGILVPPGDHVALADAIMETLADPENLHRSRVARDLAFATCGWRARARDILTFHNSGLSHS